MWYRLTGTSLALLGLAWTQNADKGKILFQQRCAACHKLDQKLIGPPLAGLESRLKKEWFFRFVANSQALIQAGDKEAVAVYNEYNKQVMPPFPDLTPADLEDLWAYINSVKEAPATPAAGIPAQVSEPSMTYPGQARPLQKEDWAFLRQTFWLLVGAAVGVALLLGVVIHLVSTRTGESKRS
mgnify:CR=1 FL=1